jgi:hypothetical protein
MNQTSQEIIVQPDSLRQFASNLYQKAGVSQEHAELMAEAAGRNRPAKRTFARDAHVTLVCTKHA